MTHRRSTIHGALATLQTGILKYTHTTKRTLRISAPSAWALSIVRFLVACRPRHARGDQAVASELATAYKHARFGGRRVALRKAGWGRYPCQVFHSRATTVGRQHERRDSAFALMPNLRGCCRHGWRMCSTQYPCGFHRGRPAPAMLRTLCASSQCWRLVLARGPKAQRRAPGVFQGWAASTSAVAAHEGLPSPAASRRRHCAHASSLSCSTLFPFSLGHHAHLSLWQSRSRSLGSLDRRPASWGTCRRRHHYASSGDPDRAGKSDMHVGQICRVGYHSLHAFKRRCQGDGAMSSPCVSACLQLGCCVLSRGAYSLALFARDVGRRSMLWRPSGGHRSCLQVGGGLH